MNARKQLAIVVVILMLGFTTVSGLAWITNVQVSWAHHTRVFEEYRKQLEKEQQQESSQMQNETLVVRQQPKEQTKRPKLRFVSMAVDHSTVTTFIPMITSLLLCLVFMKIAFTKEGTPVPAFFIFSRKMDEIIVGLGLIGTVWGLILIGYGGNDVKMKDLIGCLNTALFSTFIALIWVFIIKPIVEPTVISFYRFAIKPEAISQTQFIEELENLGVQGKITSNDLLELSTSASTVQTALANVGSKAEALGSAFEEAKKKVGVDLAKEVKWGIDTCKEITMAAKETLTTVSQAIAIQQENMDDLKQAIAAENASIGTIQAAATALAAESDRRQQEAAKQTEAMRDLVASCSATTKDVATKVAGESAKRKRAVAALCEEAKARQQTLKAIEKSVNQQTAGLVTIQKMVQRMIEYMAKEANRSIRTSRQEIVVLKKRSSVLGNFAKRLSKRMGNGDSFAEEWDEVEIER
jgi:hypothetical protein